MQPAQRMEPFSRHSYEPNQYSPNRRNPNRHEKAGQSLQRVCRPAVCKVLESSILQFDALSVTVPLRAVVGAQNQDAFHQSPDACDGWADDENPADDGQQQLCHGLAGVAQVEVVHAEAARGRCQADRLPVSTSGRIRPVRRAGRMPAAARRRAGYRRIGCKTGPRSLAVRSSLGCNPAGRKRCWGHTPGLPADRTTAAQIGQAGTAGHTDRTGCTMRRSDHIPEQRAWPAEPAGYRREPYRMPGPESPADRMTAERSGPTVRAGHTGCMRKRSDRTPERQARPAERAECMRRSSDRMRGFRLRLRMVHLRIVLLWNVRLVVVGTGCVIRRWIVDLTGTIEIGVVITHVSTISQSLPVIGRLPLARTPKNP